MAALTQIIICITIKLAETNTKLVQPLVANSILTRYLVATKGDNGLIRPPFPGNVSYTHYCHTYSIRSSHSSKDYKIPADGHKIEDTDTSRMGRRTTKWKPNKHKWIEPEDKLSNNNINIDNQKNICND